MLTKVALVEQPPMQSNGLMLGSVGVKLVSVAAVRAGVHFPVVQVDVHLRGESCVYYTPLLVVGVMYHTPGVFGAFTPLTNYCTLGWPRGPPPLQT